MRISLEIDDDVLQVARERARREQRSVGQVISDLARQAITHPVDRSFTERNGFPVLARRGTPVTQGMVEALRDEAGV